MANKTIAQLTAAVAAAGSNLIEIDDGAGGSFKLTLSQVLALMAATNPSVIVESGATPEKISQFTGAATPINSNYLMPFADTGIANYKYSVANLVNDIFDQGDNYTIPFLFFTSGSNATITDNIGTTLSLAANGGASLGNASDTRFSFDNSGTLMMVNVNGGITVNTDGMATFDFPPNVAGGSSAQFLKADGTLDSTAYATATTGQFTATGTATTSFVVTIGNTQAGTNYKVLVSPRNALSAAVWYISAKTTTTFTVTYLAGLTGAVAFDWALLQ